MSQTCARHDRQRHQARGSGHPGVEAGADRPIGRPQDCRAQQQEADRDEGVGDMEYQDEAVGERAIARPAQQANSLQQSRDDQHRAADAGLGEYDPRNQREHTAAYRDRIEPRKRYRKPAGIAPRQPIVGEARHDTSADQRDERDDCRDTKTGAVFGAAVPDDFQMKSYIAGDQYSEQDENAEIAFVVASDDLARDRGRQQHQEGDVDRRGEPRTPK